MTLTEPERHHLVDLAWTVIRTGSESRIRTRPQPPEPGSALLARRATFVTLTQGGRLRGCCGSIEAHRALIDDVAENAWRTAFEDPRFPPVQADEVAELALEISVLSPLTPVAAHTEATLTAALQPGVDGLVLSKGRRRATFLPKVWESLPETDQFLRQLLVKAGILPEPWPRELEAWRYTVERIS